MKIIQWNTRVSYQWSKTEVLANMLTVKITGDVFTEVYSQLYPSHKMKSSNRSDPRALRPSSEQVHLSHSDQRHRRATPYVRPLFE